MKIALFTDGISPFVIGGMQKHSYYLAKYLAKNSIYVHLYHTPFHSPRSEEMIRLSCFTDEEKKYITAELIDFPKFYSFPGHYLYESYVYSCRIYKKFLQNPDVDFIYAKGFTAWKLLEEKRKGKKNSPIGVNFHGMNMFDKAYSIKSKLEQWLLRPPVNFNLTHADYVFSYGGKITNLLISKTKISKKKIIEVPAGIEKSWLIDNINPPADIRKFIFIGRYDKIKGIQELLQVIRNFKKKSFQNENVAFEFHFIGPILEHISIPQINKDDSGVTVIYHGNISDSEKIKFILRGCDVLVLPSYSEGMPNVILESMASGLAIIATDVGAVNLLVSSDNGWLIEKCSMKAITDAMLDAISLPNEKLSLMKEKSLTKIKNNFLWENIAEVLICKIKEVVS
ncbi:MAG: glycosyltransferase family 4 protein [Bacteroidota bacterium]